MKATPFVSTNRRVASTVFGGEKPSSSETMLSLRPLTAALLVDQVEIAAKSLCGDTGADAGPLTA